ncbi:oleosin S1-2 [Sesamum indicum]|uniref:Oleosin S1-2 n=1 Tax=Sesamum indicum TaxID=4182 RepID=A0A6I9UCE1_SESIN|nr:oleosin S1-2 [Sesamum indicum]
MEKHHITELEPRHFSGRTVLLASIAGVIIGGPLLALMGISFLATVTLLLVASPLLLIFSPVLFGAACVLALAVIGFAAAGAMAVAGVSAVAWVVRSFTSRRAVQFRSGLGVSDKLIEGGDEEEQGKDWAGYIQQKPYLPHENVLINRG